MSVAVARDLQDAIGRLADDEHAELLAGGTDLMVDINFQRHRPASIVAIDRIDELRTIQRNGMARIGAGVTYTRLIREDCGSAALREASRTVGSPQIRNVGTIGGNLGTASPAGDTLPVLAALDATIVLRSGRGERRVSFADFHTGPKKSARLRDEVIVAAEWDDAGPAQTFMKVGTRNAMVIAVASLALVIDRARRRVGIGLGSCGPTILGSAEGSRFAEGLLGEGGWERPLRASEGALAEFGRLVSGSARPIDDVRGTRAYRSHVLAVLAARALARAGAIA